MSEIINLCDTSFREYCYDKFGVDREVIHNVDSTFYKYGFKNVYYRRKTIIQFLNYVSGDKKNLLSRELIQTIEKYIFRDYIEYYH